MDKQKTYTVFAIIILCLMAFVFGVILAPKFFEIAQINLCNQKTIDANHNGISDYLEKSLIAGGYCGDGICDPSTENSVSCPTDCSASSSSRSMGYCGDNICDPATENSVSCPTDCVSSSGSSSSRGYCGDNICDPATENSVSCPTDCSSYIGYFH